MSDLPPLPLEPRPGRYRHYKGKDYLVLGLAPYHGRVFMGSAKIAEQSPGPGTVLPQLVHGGPGRAGGGEELGGVRGLAFYMQRVALEGSRPLIEKLTGAKT